MAQVIVFALGFLAILAISWPSLRQPRTHGFYRFFAFTAIVALVALGVETWWRNPFSPRQVVSWLLLAGSALLAAHGFYLLRVIGHPDGPIESTTRLVRAGAYGYVRHPLYTSLLLFAGGAFLKNPSWAAAVLLLVAVAALLATAGVEEQENLARFGQVYTEYMRETKRFIPGVW